MLNVENPAPEVLKQKRCVQYILRSVLDGPSSKDKRSMERLRLVIHGPGGCGKSVVTRAAAHMLRQGGKGTVLAAPTGVAAFNVNGVTLHSSLLLPVENQSYGKVCDVLLPRGEQLALLQSFWKRVDVLMVDGLSFVSSALLDRIDQHLRLARDMPHVPFGGVHIIFIGDLYQLPPPGGGCGNHGLPIFASKLRVVFELCELEGNQRAGNDPGWAALLARIRVGEWTDADIETLQRMAFKKHDKRKPAEGAVHLFATRQQVAKRNNDYIEDFAAGLNREIYESPAADISSFRRPFAT
eukprot:s2382_g7.t1